MPKNKVHFINKDRGYRISTDQYQYILDWRSAGKKKSYINRSFHPTLAAVFYAVWVALERQGTKADSEYKLFQQAYQLWEDVKKDIHTLLQK